MEYGLEVNAEVDERYHIEKSTRAACRYLKDSYAKYRDWAVVAASYNAGTAAVDRQIGRQKETSYFDLLFPKRQNGMSIASSALRSSWKIPKNMVF